MTLASATRFGSSDITDRASRGNVRRVGYEAPGAKKVTEKIDDACLALHVVAALAVVAASNDDDRPRRSLHLRCCQRKRPHVFIERNVEDQVRDACIIDEEPVTSMNA